MRKALEFVAEYRRKGYPDDRIRIIASMRPEPLRGEVLKFIEENASTPDTKPASSETSSPTSTEKPAISPDITTASASTKPEAKTKNPAPAERANSGHRESADVKALRAQVGDLHKEREQLLSDLKKTRTEIERLRVESAEREELRKRVAEMESIQKELADVRAVRAESNGHKDKIEATLSQLKTALENKESLLSEKDEFLSEMEESLKRERTEREEAVARANELSVALEEQAESQRQLDSVNQKLAAADISVKNLRGEVAKLRESEKGKIKQISEMESEMGHMRTDADLLREQLESNELAVSDLQQRLTVRESELESLRAHFDQEATDLKKRAEQEMWIIQRRMRRLRRLAAVGGGVAALLLVVLISGYFSEEPGTGSKNDRIVAGDRQRPSSPLASNNMQDLRTPPLTIPSRSPTPSPATTTTTLTPSTTTVRHARGAYREYVVQRGDSFWNIGKKFYGNGARGVEIAHDNNMDPKAVLKPGTKLRIIQR